MGERLRMAVGVIGNVTSLLLYAAPTLTFAIIARKRSTEEYSCIPYIIALLNCFVYTWYGLPIVSCRWKNFSLVTVNGVGFLLESSFIIIYFWFASARSKINVGIGVVLVILVSSITAAISAFVFDDHHRRKIFVGSVGFVVSASMYGSPLVAMKKVIRMKSVEFMPFYLSLFSFLTSTTWMTYGLLSRDLILTAPSMVGFPLGFLQLVVYFVYKRRETMQEIESWGLENDEEKAKPLQEATGEGDK